MSLDPSDSTLQRLLGDARWLGALARELAGAAGEDLLQDAWVVALERPPAHPAAARVWFARVLASLARSRRSTESARSAREREHACEEALESSADVVARAESQRWLVGHVLALAEPYRATILQRYFDGLASAEIARRAGVPESTVRNRLARGLTELRTRLERERGRDFGLALGPLLAAPARPWRGLEPWTGVLLVKKLGVACLLVVLAALWFARRPAEGGAETTVAQELSPVVPVSSSSRAAPTSESAVASPAAALARESLPESSTPVPAGELRGRVFTTSGEPVPGARVRAQIPIQTPRDGSEPAGPEDALDAGETRTDAEGRFALGGFDGRGIDLWIEAEGFARERRPWVLPESELHIVLARPARLVGRLVREPEGAPGAGVMVRVSRGPLPMDFLRSAELTSDTEGRFAFEALVPGCYTLAAEGQVFGSLVLEEGRTATFEGRLQAKTFIEGRVEDARNGQAIAGARVWRSEDVDRTAVLTNADGEFRLDGVPLVRALSIVRASAPGYADGQLPPLWSLDESGARVVVRLFPGRRCSGRVVAADGKPLANAAVTAKAAGSEWRRDERKARSGPDGRFELSGLRADLRHTLIVHAEGHARAVFDFPARELELEVLELGDLPLEPPTRIAGVVVDRAGRPLIRHLVIARGEPAARDRLGPAESGEGYLEAFGGRDPETLTDDLGRFVFADLPSGEWAFAADRKGWWHGSEVAVTLALGEQRSGLTLVVEEGLALAGVVLDEEEHALAGMIVDLYAAGEQGRALYAFTDEHGHFEFHGLASGDYAVAASSGFGSRDLFVEARNEGIAAGTTDVRLVLERSVAQRVRVVDREGDPLPGAFVGLVDATGNAGNLAASDDDGLITLHVSARTIFALRAFANRQFDPKADLLDVLFLDEQGNCVPEMSAERTGLTASADVIELVIPGLP